MANGTDIGQAYIQVMPSAEGIKGRLEGLLGAEGAAAGKGFASRFAGALGTLGKGMVTATAALGAGVTAAGGAFAAAAGNVAQYGDNIDKMSQKLGMSAKSYQEWDFVLQHNGASIESMGGAMKKLAVAAETNNKAFAALGMTQEQIAGMSQEELFSATISALQGVADETQRTYLASQLLGRGATELGPLLNMSAEDMEAMRKQAHELGGVMSDESVKAAAQFQDSLQNMQTAISGAGRSFVAAFLPGMSDMMDGIGDIFAGGDGARKIRQGVDQLIQTAETAIPQAMEVGGQIVGRLGDAIAANAPRLAEMGGRMLLTVARGLVEKLPAIPRAAFAMFQSLSGTLAEQLPELVPVAVEAVVNFVDGVITNSDKLIDGALALMGALAEGVAKAIPILVAKAPALVLHFIEALIRNLPKIVGAGGEIMDSLTAGIEDGLWQMFHMGERVVQEWIEGVNAWGRSLFESGRDMLDLFIQGIRDRLPNLSGALSGIGQTVRDYIGFSEPKTGPLSNFHSYAPDMMALYAQGISGNAWRVRSALEESMDLSDAFRGPGALGISGAQMQPAQPSTPEPRFVDGGGANRRPERITVVLTLDRAELGRAVVTLGDEEYQRIGLRLATR